MEIYDKLPKISTCPMCDGYGYCTTIVDSNGHILDFGMKIPCIMCNGIGKIEINKKAKL